MTLTYTQKKWRRYARKNRAHLKARDRTRYQTSRASELKRNREYRHKNRTVLEARRLLRQYGVTIQQIDRLLTRQKNRCAICKNPFSSAKARHIDHCHSRKKVRGILCQLCNMALGLLKDSPALLRAAAKYLERNS